MDFFSTAWDWFKGGGITASLAKTALLGYASKLLNKTTEPVSSGSNEIVDKGVRLQLDPDTENKIPVLYGEAYFGGYITDAQLSADYKKMTYCLTLAELTGTKISNGQASTYTFQGVYINNNRVVFKADGFTVDYTLDSSGNQDVSFRDLIKIYFYCDQTGVQPVGSSGTTPSPFTTMPGWSAGTHSMEDLMYAIVEVTYNRDSGVNGIPNCLFHAKNNMVLPGDIIADYMTNTVYGAGIDGNDIDGTSLTDLNSFCTTGFSYTNLSNQTTNSPIHINGLIDTNTDVLTNIQALAEAASSWLTYDIHSGLWKVIINKAGSSVASFTDSNIVGEISISGTSLIQLNNIADVKYQNTDILDKTDFVKISIPSGDLFANEPLNSIQINLPFTNKQVVAAKIGLQQLKQARVDKIINFKADYSYILLNAGDIVSITNSTYGFSSKLFRIITVTQSEGDSGEILLDFTCLEYDADVYSYDINEYLVESDNGILGIGSIGKPNTPSVTKTEQANVPKIDVTAVVPSGIVETMEFWITFDTGISNDSLRNYSRIGGYSNIDGSILSEDETVVFTYSQLQQSNFYIKVRGVNGITTGPYSDPSGLVAYVPVVVADTLSDTPVSIGGQLMGLGLLTLLNNLDGLYNGLFGSGSLVDKVIDAIKDATGVDLKSGGPGVPGADGADGAAGKDGKDAGVCTLSFDKTRQYPTDRSTLENPETPYPNVKKMGPRDPNSVTLSGSLADNADPTGNYYFSFSEMSTYEMSAGSGDVKLYKSDGTLVETIAAASLVIDKTNGIINIPFASRANKTDFYITMDQGVIVSSIGCQSPALENSTAWNFHTDTPAPRPELTPLAPPKPPGSCPPLKLTKVVTKKFKDVIAENNLKTDIETNVVLYWNQGITLAQTGTITILSSGGTHQTFDLSKTFENDKISEELVKVQGDRLYINPTTDFARGTTYWMTITANAIKTNCGNYGNTAISNSTTITWTTDNGPTSDTVLPPASSSANESGLGMKFDQPVARGAGEINIKDSGGNIIKTIPGTNPAVTGT